MASDFVIRPALEDEFAPIGALTVAGYDADGYLTHADGTFDEHYASWLRDGQTRGRDGVLVVAASADSILGTVTWCPPGSPYRELATHKNQGEFRTLAVSQDARGRGVGRALVKWCVDQARTEGLREMVLSSLPEMAPAHRLYESLGFIRRPDLDWSPIVKVNLWGYSLDLTASITVRS